MKYLIILLLLSSCETYRAANKTSWLKSRGFLTDSSTTTTTFKTGETILILDTTFLKSVDTIKTDSTLIIEKHFYNEKRFYSKDTLIINNNKTIHIKPAKQKWYEDFKIYLLAILILILLLVIKYK
jgi:hypothetical protein